MWDFGNWRGEDFQSSSVIVTGYNAVGENVALDAVSGETGFGGACSSAETPGNKVFLLQGTAMNKVVILFTGTNDPDIGFGNVCYTKAAPTPVPTAPIPTTSSTDDDPPEEGVLIYAPKTNNADEDNSESSSSPIIILAGIAF